MIMVINPGEFKHRIKILQIIKVQDINLNYIETKKVVRTCFAKVSHIVGSEIARAETDYRDSNIRFFVRHNKDITTDMFIEFRGVLYDIFYVNNYYESDEYDEIWCNAKEDV